MPVEIGSGTNTVTNRVEVLDSDSGTAPTIRSVGPDTNVDLALDGQGTGTVLVNGSEIVNVADAQVLHDKTLVTAILTNPKISSIHDVNDNTGLEIAAVPSAVNHLAIANAAAGSGPYLFSTGPDANISIGLFPAGTGAVILGTGGGQTILAVGHTGSVANAFGITAGAAGSGPTLAAFGSDTDVDFNVLTQGAGHFKVNGAIIDTTSTHALASKTTPVDADEIPLVDSAASFGLKKLTWVNLKATLATWLTNLTATWTNKTLTAPSINYITDANGYPIFNMIPGAGAIANYLATLNSSTGQPVVLAAVGADTNIDLNVAGQGSGAVNVIGDLNVYAPSSTVSTVSATGVNPNLDLNLVSKNSGVVKINGVPAADRAYVDATVQGLQVKPTADVVAISAFPAGTYNNGTAGVGATFTVTGTGTTTVDGHVLAVTELVLLTAQASAFQNGLYSVTVAGATGVATVLTRHVDMDTATEFAGAFVPVGNKGTANLNSLWLANPSGAVTVGTTSIPFTQLNGATDLVPGNAISIIGNTIAVSGTTANFNTALTDDDFATLTNTVNLLNKTLTNPKINAILGANGNVVLDMVDATGAQNWIRIFNEPTGVGAVIEAVGFDANVDLNLLGQGTGKVKAWDGSVFREVANTTELAAGVTTAEARANHTGTQAASTISDFATTVDAEIPVAIHASSAKATPVDADEFVVLDSATSFSLKKYTLANLKTVLAAWIAPLTAVWTNKTLTAPVLQHPAVDYVTDTNGAPALLFSAVPSAVNYVDILNNATGAGPYIAGVGSDANVDLNLIGQGTGKPKIGGAPIATTTDVATGVTTAEARANHTGTQSADTIVDGTTNKVLTATDKTRLASTSGTNTGDQTSVSGNAGTATALQTPRNINGVAFDGTAAITVADSTKQLLYLVTALKTADYLSIGNEFVPMDTTSGSKTITFPTAPADGTQVGSKIVVQGGTNTVSFACGGSDHINTTTGLTSAVALTKLNQAINYKYNAASAVWYVTSTDVPFSLLATLTDVQALTHKDLTDATNTFPTALVSGAAAGATAVQPGGALGTPSSGTATNLTGLPLTGLLAAAYATAATASTLAERDANANLTADAFIPSSTSTATAAGTTTLTVDSTEVQIFTGVTTQTVLLPTTSVVAGQRYTIINTSTGQLTVNASAGGIVGTIPASFNAVLIALQAAPTTAAHWSIVYQSGISVNISSNAATIVRRDAQSNILSDAFIPGFTTTATAAGTTTLTVDSTEVQQFTGVTTQTCVLPTTSIVAGQRYTILSSSTGAIAINASGGANVASIGSSTMVTVVALQATPTTAAHWALSYGTILPFVTASSVNSIPRRDQQANLTADAFIPGFTTTATAAGTTTLTVDSTEVQEFTGVTTQTVVLPTTSVVAGQRYKIVNNSTGAVTVQSSGANTILAISGGVTVSVTALVATPTTAANWSAITGVSANITAGSAASTIATRDAVGNLAANAFRPSFTTTATAAGTTTLTIAATEVQQFTGVTTQTVLLPTTSVAAGHRITIINKSTGVVTVQSSGANTVMALSSTVSATFVALIATPTAAADWQAVYQSPITATSSASATTLVQRQSNANITANAFLPNLVATATAAGTTTLVVGSFQTQVFTGATTQTVVLPTTTVAAGQEWKIINTSSGAITINASDATLVKTLAAGAFTIVTSLQITPTTNTHWYATA